MWKKKERKAKRLAELKNSKAKKDEVDRELARLDQESKEEAKRVEVRYFILYLVRDVVIVVVVVGSHLCCALLRNIDTHHLMIGLEAPTFG